MRETRSGRWTAGLIAAVICSTSGPAVADFDCFAVVIHAENTTQELEARRLSKMFLKRIKRWDSGDLVVVVDQAKDSPVRNAFSKAVHRKSPRSVAKYWQHMIFSGRDTPPREMAGDQEVLEFVRSERGALGYVSCDAALPPGVRAFELAKSEPTTGGWRLFESRKSVTARLRWPARARPGLLDSLMETSLSLPEHSTLEKREDLWLYLGEPCGDAGRRVWLMNRDPDDVVDALTVDRLFVDGELRRRARTRRRLSPSERRELGCSHDRGAKLSFELEDVQP